MLPLSRRWRPGRPVPVRTLLGPLRRGAGDPAFRDVGAEVWRAARTPEGPVTLHVCAAASTDEVMASAWGPGAAWTLDQVPAMLGDDDRGADEFAAAMPGLDPFLIRAQRRHPHWRVPRSGLVFEALLASVLEQKVTGQEAWAGWRALLYRFGEVAPGPGAQLAAAGAAGP